MRVFFTGGSGKAGRHVVAYLAERGHRVMNVDRVALGHPGVHDLIADITDAGQMYSAMQAHAGFDEFETGRGAQTFDAVVHFAAVPRMLLAPDTETWRVNVVGTYNVIEAAVKMGVRKIIVASSETTYGICFADGTVLPKVLPLDEDYPIDPMDSYGLSKKVNEVTAQGFQRRSGADIYALRIGNVIEPHEYMQNFPGYFANPDVRLRNAFCYIDARDLGQIVDRCLATDGLGFQVFNAANDGHSVNLTTEALLARYYAGVPVSRAMGPDEGFLSNARIREMLGFREEHPWRKYVTA
jgi:nucleoside-diphosphate-sugar epimerase